MSSVLKNVVALAKRRGFIFPGSEIYGGLANTYDLGPLGASLRKNVIDLWWTEFVEKRPDVYGLDTSVLMSPKVWQASGHAQSFADVLVDCKTCQFRGRADHLIEDKLKDVKVEGRTPNQLFSIIEKEKITCPECGKFNWTKPRQFNLLFKTKIGIIKGEKNTAYLRGETAQGMFVNFKNILDSFHPSLPFGLAQIGKAFRNEITMGKFTFRVLEFDLAEFEYFIKEKDWEAQFDYWKVKTQKFAEKLGVDKKKLRWRSHTKDELSHYSKKTEDLEYKYPFGFKEWFAVAYRTDYDLKNHAEKSGVDLRYQDLKTGGKFIPHVIEPTFGITRSLTTLLVDAYKKDEKRTYLKLSPLVAPYKAAVFPLLANKEKLVKMAKGVFNDLLKDFSVAFDDRGNIGKRYYAQDEIGTPFCITVDFDSLEKNDVTVRDRDTTKQIRISVSQLKNYLKEKIQ